MKKAINQFTKEQHSEVLEYFKYERDERTKEVDWDDEPDFELQFQGMSSKKLENLINDIFAFINREMNPKKIAQAISNYDGVAQFAWETYLSKKFKKLSKKK